MDFLSQTEQKLAAEISGNHQSLLEQQRDHEVRALNMLMAANGWFCAVFALCTVSSTCVCVFAVVPGRDVQQATDSLLHHQRWPSYVGPRTDG